jgi:hypothetical protein
MGGPIQDDALRVCRACGLIWLEDARFAGDGDHCPRCGADPAGPDREIKGEDDEYAQR